MAENDRPAHHLGPNDLYQRMHRDAIQRGLVAPVIVIVFTDPDGQFNTTIPALRSLDQSSIDRDFSTQAEIVGIASWYCPFAFTTVVNYLRTFRHLADKLTQPPTIDEVTIVAIEGWTAAIFTMPADRSAAADTN